MFVRVWIPLFLHLFDPCEALARWRKKGGLRNSSIWDTIDPETAYGL